MSPTRKDVWASGKTYEPYVGRWSRLVAGQLLAWLAVPNNRTWLDVGCGTGALTRVIVENTDARSVAGVDPSEGYIAYAREHVRDDRVQFQVGDAQRLPYAAASFDAVVSGLMLNFVPEPAQAVAEMTRVARPHGMVAVYVWDYAGKMELIRYFWDAAVALNPEAQDLDEGRRFPLCKPESLQRLFIQAGLREVEVKALDVPTRFKDFDDYWSPFLGGQAPAPGYAMSLTEERRDELRERIRGTLPIEPDGSIRLVARAWAVRGTP